jgi:hypothetical protein
MTPGTTYTIISEPYYNTKSQCYTNALVINAHPDGPLNKFVRRTQFPILSPFNVNNNCNNCGDLNKCKLMIMKDENCPMSPDDIPFLFSFLTKNGYQIETKITEMLTMGPVKINSGEILCLITYYTTAPNVTYMR